MSRHHEFLAKLFWACALSLPIAAVGTENLPTSSPGRNYNLGTDRQSNTPQRRVRDMAKPVVMDVSAYQLTPTEFHVLALKAMLKRGWKIEQNEATRIQGLYVKRNEEFKSVVRFNGQRIILEFVPGFHNDRDNWLRNLEEDINLELQLRVLHTK